MSEAQFQTFFSKWMMYRFFLEFPELAGLGIGYDLKVVSGLSLAPSKVYEHQIRNLINVGGEIGVHSKIADVGPAKKPFDAFFIKNGYGFLGILYKKETPDERFFGIFNMKNWNGESVTPERCDALFKFKGLQEIPERITS